MLLLLVIKIILYVILFNGGRTNNGLNYRALACFGLLITNIITIFVGVTTGSSFILPVIMVFWWLILGIILIRK